MTRLALLAALALCGTAAAKDPYGPSWVGGGPPGGHQRPDKVETTRTAVGLGEVGNPIGVQVRLWGDVGNVQAGHKYQLMYQLRLQTKKGETGPLLGDATRPNGVAYTLKTITAGENWNGIEGEVDITRAMLSGLTGLPKASDPINPVILRVEPQLFDVTADKFVSEVKTPCLFLVVTMWDGKARAVAPLHTWLANNSGKVATHALAALDTLDVYDAEENRLHEYFGAILDQPVLNADDMPSVVKAIPADLLASKSGYAVRAKLEALAKDEKAAEHLRAAAKAKLDEK